MGDVVRDVNSKTVDDLAQLPGAPGVPYRPCTMALAVSHGVVGPGLEGLAGLVLGARHIGRDFTAWLLGSEWNDLTRRDLGGSLGRNWFNDRFRRVTGSGCISCTTPVAGGTPPSRVRK